MNPPQEASLLFSSPTPWGAYSSPPPHRGGAYFSPPPHRGEPTLLLPHTVGSRLFSSPTPWGRPGGGVPFRLLFFVKIMSWCLILAHLKTSEVISYSLIALFSSTLKISFPYRREKP
jgi:hypothetical protein